MGVDVSSEFRKGIPFCEWWHPRPEFACFLSYAATKTHVFYMHGKQLIGRVFLTHAPPHDHERKSSCAQSMAGIFAVLSILFFLWPHSFRSLRNKKWFLVSQ